MDQYLKAQLLKADIEVLLSNIHNLYEESASGVFLAKHAVTTLKNVFDFHKTLRRVYKEHRWLSDAIKPCYGELEFSNYLRNNISGHVDQEAIQQMLSWRPELINDLQNMDVTENVFHFNKLLMVYVFNSYVDQDGKHNYYKEDYLAYIEYDFEKFLGFLQYTINKVQTYMQLVCSALKVEFDQKLELVNFEKELVLSNEHTFQRLKS